MQQVTDNKTNKDINVDRKSKKKAKKRLRKEAMKKDLISSAKLVQKFELYSKSQICRLKEKHQPRVALTSIFQFWRLWRKIPLDILYHSIIILNLKREWLFPKSNEMTTSVDKRTEQYRLLSQFIGNAGHSVEQFKTLLQLKENQKLLLWIDPESTQSEKVVNSATVSPKSISDLQQCDSPSVSIPGVEKLIIDPKWTQISDFLMKIKDPITRTDYNPIITDENWWVDKYHSTGLLKEYPQFTQGWDDVLTQLEYCDSYYSIRSELSNMQFKFKPFQEILRQSNITLVPMTAYNEEIWRVKGCKIAQFQTSFFTAKSDNDFSIVKCDQLIIDIDTARSMAVKPDSVETDGFVFVD